jgi:hypothetical protein
MNFSNTPSTTSTAYAGYGGGGGDKAKPTTNSNRQPNQQYFTQKGEVADLQK